MRNYFGYILILLSILQIESHPFRRETKKEVTRRIYKTIYPYYRVNEVSRVKEALLKQRVLENVYHLDSLKSTLKRALDQEFDKGSRPSKLVVENKRFSIPYSFMFRKREIKPPALGLWGREDKTPSGAEIGPPGLWGDVVPDDKRSIGPGLWGKDAVKRVLHVLGDTETFRR